MMNRDPVADLRALYRAVTALTQDLRASWQGNVTESCLVVEALCDVVRRKYAPVEAGEIEAGGMLECYQPKACRPYRTARLVSAYACAYCVPTRKGVGYDPTVFAGPFDDLAYALEVVPRPHVQMGCVLLRLEVADRDTVLYHWDEVCQAWIKGEEGDDAP